MATVIETRQRQRIVGAEVLPDGAVHVRVWAPHAEKVAAVLEEGPGTTEDTVVVPLQPEERGYFAAVLPGAAAGTRYRFRLDDDGTLFPDPASRFQPEGVHGPSAVVDLTFPWEVDRWSVPPLRDWVIYELHVGTFSPVGTFEGVIPRLPYLKELGVTAIELMPIAQFPGARNWGYDGVFPYAPQHSYGDPDGLRRLVDAAHREGLAVVLDVVYNHFGPEGNVTGRFGPYVTGSYCTPWGDAINFDGPDSDEVRAFFIDSALMWLEEYRVDAFRLDAVHAIFDPLAAEPFLAALGEAIHARAASLGRRAVLIAESDLNQPRLILPRESGGYALDAQWADDFHHALEVQLRGEESSYATDYAGFARLGDTLRQAFVYTGQYSQKRRRRHGHSPAPARRDQFVVFIQNHDQVGNRPGGERLGHLISPAARRLAAATVLLSPFVPLLFMGEEYGEPHPFLYFTDHGDPDLVAAVRAGRREEFAHWDWDDAAPDPQDVATFERSRVQLALHTRGEHATLFAFYRELIAARRAFPVLTDPVASRDVIVREAERVLITHASGEAGEALVVLGFGDDVAPVLLPLPAGEWVKRLDADDPRFGGEGSLPLAGGGRWEGERVPERLHSEGAIELTVPPHAALLFERVSSQVSEEPARAAAGSFRFPAATR
jgi:maltooligosyltrehalose trehalohydrolase